MTTEQRRLIQAYQNLFQTEDGKLVLDDLSRNLFENEQTFVIDSPDQSAFNQGSRRAILWIRWRIGMALEPQGEETAITKENP